MPSPQDKGYFLEFNESFLLAARTVSSGRPLVIEELREASLDNKSAVDQALSAVFPATGATTPNVLCSLRPRNRFFLLATEKDTPKVPSLAAMRALVGNSPFASAGPSELIGVDAHSGLPIDGKSGNRLLLAGAPKESLDGMRATLGEWKIAPSRLVAATVGLLGVISAEQQRAKAGPVLVWEIGESTSDLFLVGAQGLEIVKRLPFGLDRVADGVQAELNLKFRGAATKLFFNEYFDFSENGPRITSRVAGSLQPVIAEIAGGGVSPTALLCTGLVSRQNWFTQQMAKSLNLAPWQPDVIAWCSSAGLTFIGNTLQPKLSPSWLGLLGVMGAVQPDRADADSAWQPAWSVDGVEREVKPRAAEVVVHAPEPVVVPAPARAPVVPPAPAPKIIPPTPAVFAAAAAVRPPAVAVPSKAPVPAAPKAPAAPTPPPQPAKQEKDTPARAATPASAMAPAPAAVPAAAATPKAPATPVRPAAAPTPAATPETIPAAAGASPRPPAAKPRTSDERPAASRSFFKTPAGLAIVGVLVVVLGLGAFMFYRQYAAAEAAHKQFMKEKETALLEKTKAEQRAAEAAENLRKAEENAKVEAAARKHAEEEAAQKAAEEYKRLEAETKRVLDARGSLVIVTEPAGASVAISNFTPHVSPATINDMRLGRYTLNITLAGYEPMSLEVEIKENAATDPGVIHLVRQVGSLEITTNPAGISFEVHPAPPRVSTSEAEVRQGKTPATLAGLPTGDYVITFKRQGWPDHTENATIERAKTAQVTSKYPGGSVTISSTPTGASVIRDGETLGQTPLTLNDLQPGEATYALELAGFISTTVTGQIEPEKTLTLSGVLSPEDRIVTLKELDERPVAIKTVNPVIGSDMGRNGGSATISLTVDRDGTPKDLKVESASEPEFGKRCLAAVAQWRFKPGTINGVPVRTRVSVPFNL